MLTTHYLLSFDSERGQVPGRKEAAETHPGVPDQLQVVVEEPCQDAKCAHEVVIA